SAATRRTPPASSCGSWCDGGADPGRQRRHLTVAAIALARPEEPAETVLAPPGHHVGVEVGHALADGVVDGDEGAMGLERLLHGAGDPLHPLEVGTDLVVGEVEKRHDMAPGHDQHVAWEHRTLVEEGHRHLVVEHDVRRLLAGDDAAEDVVGASARHAGASI